ncbi:MAG: 4Fe-4S dicluster domain-containing protein [Candidatus Helarchaeota archaeon]
MSSIEININKCTGCLICQFQCSFQYYKEFNLNKSRIKINKSPYDTASITFTEDCTNCGTCARYCAYGALKYIKGDND